MLPQIYEICKIAFKSAYSKIHGTSNITMFEIFGCDFIFDETGNPFLLEINTNPGLEESSPLIKKLVPRMIDDCLRLTIDDLFITKYSKNVLCPETNEYNSPFSVDGYNNSENLWKLLCNIK